MHSVRNSQSMGKSPRRLNVPPVSCPCFFPSEPSPADQLHADQLEANRRLPLSRPDICGTACLIICTLRPSSFILTASGVPNFRRATHIPPARNFSTKWPKLESELISSVIGSHACNRPVSNTSLEATASNRFPRFGSQLGIRTLTCSTDQRGPIRQTGVAILAG